MKLSGKVVVITGSLRPLCRQEAIFFLEKQGAIVQNYVTSQTDILITGHKQLSLFEPDYYSKKYEIARLRQEEGQKISFLSEEDFFQLLKQFH